jgi:hypothetical protein
MMCKYQLAWLRDMAIAIIFATSLSSSCRRFQNGTKSGVWALCDVNESSYGNAWNGEVRAVKNVPLEHVCPCGMKSLPGDEWEGRPSAPRAEEPAQVSQKSLSLMELRVLLMFHEMVSSR